MTISGMTGFGRAEGRFGELTWLWEIKSVNGRSLDLKLRLPLGFEALEAPAREAAAKLFKRGSLQATLSLAQTQAAPAALRVDLGLAERLIAAGQPLVDSGLVDKPRWDGLLAVRGVVVAEDVAVEDEEARLARDAALLAGFQVALAGLDMARRQEGAMLDQALRAHADRLDALTASAKALAAAAPGALLERLRQRLSQLAPELNIDPQRLAQEAALLASKADVQEELERLEAHAREFRALIASAEPAGRRLDFLAQELTREANTLCSKANDLELTRIGLELKAVIDQVKEQAANVE